MSETCKNKSQSTTNKRQPTKRNTTGEKHKTTEMSLSPNQTDSNLEQTSTTAARTTLTHHEPCDFQAPKRAQRRRFNRAGRRCTTTLKGTCNKEHRRLDMIYKNHRRHKRWRRHLALPPQTRKGDRSNHKIKLGSERK